MRLRVTNKLLTETCLRLVTGATLGMIFWVAYFYFPPLVLTTEFLLVLAYILVFEWPCVCPLNHAWCWALAPFYPIFPFVVMVLLNNVSFYRPVLFFAFMLAPAFDTGSYLLGKLFGRHALCVPISPEKTWEGFLGGVLAIAATLIFTIGRHVSVSSLLLLTLGISVSALAGDLLESWLKRAAGVKDASQVLPGHGGLLDRFDSIIAVVLFCYLLRDYLAPLLARSIIA